MLLAFGILSLLAGGILLAISTPGLLFSHGSINGRYPISLKLFIAALAMIAAAVVMISKGQDDRQGVSIGIVLFGTGMLLIAIGAWLGFWGPLSLRNTNKGLQFILMGLVLIVAAIVTMTKTGLPHFSGLPMSGYRSHMDWHYIFSHRMGPIPFGLFALAMFIFGNGAGLAKQTKFWANDRSQPDCTRDARALVRLWPILVQNVVITVWQ